MGDPWKRDHRGRTALHYASMIENTPITDQIAKMFTFEWNVSTTAPPAPQSKSAGFLQRIKHVFLGDSQVNDCQEIVNARDNVTGNTALHLAVQTQNYDLMVLLVNNGADVNAQNKKRQSPLHFVGQIHNIESREEFRTFLTSKRRRT